MSFHTPRDWTTGETVTEEMLDEQIKDNMNELWKYTTNGDMVYATSGSTTVRLPIGSAGQVLEVSGGVPTWKPIIAGRQGGSASDWSLAGTNDYTPTSMIMQSGVQKVSVTAGLTQYALAITFPIAFDDKPMVIVSRNASGTHWVVSAISITYVGFTLYFQRTDTSSTEWLTASWLAIGPTA